jgi:2-phosphoglycerate kinase
VKSQALSHGVPMLPNYSFDQSIAAVMDLVMERATQRAGEIRAAAATPEHRGEGKTA